MICDPIWFCIR